MSSTPLLYIHAGHPKCGSTTVRSLLANNRDCLHSQGCFLIGSGFQLAGINDALEWPLWTIEQAREQPPGYLADRLAQSLARHEGADPRALILSAENLAEPETAALLDPLLDRFDTRLIYYMRRQDHFLVSSWRQWALKRGIGFDQHVARRIAEGRPAFERVLSFWESRIGRERIHARFVDARFLERGELAADFFTAVGVEAQDCAPPTETNASPDRAILLFLQQHHHLFASVHDESPIDLMSRLDDGAIKKLTIDRHLQKSVILAYEAENQRILERFGAPGQAGMPVILDDGPDEKIEYRLTERDRGRIDRILVKLVAEAINRAAPPIAE